MLISNDLMIKIKIEFPKRKKGRFKWFRNFCRFRENNLLLFPPFFEKRNFQFWKNIQICGIGSNKSRYARHFHFAGESNERIFINFSFSLFSIVPHRHTRRQISQHLYFFFLWNKLNSFFSSLPFCQKLKSLKILIARNRILMRVAEAVERYWRGLPRSVN